MKKLLILVLAIATTFLVGCFGQPTPRDYEVTLTAPLGGELAVNNLADVIVPVDNDYFSLHFHVPEGTKRSDLAVGVRFISAQALFPDPVQVLLAGNSFPTTSKELAELLQEEALMLFTKGRVLEGLELMGAVNEIALISNEGEKQAELVVLAALFLGGANAYIQGGAIVADATYQYLRWEDSRNFTVNIPWGPGVKAMQVFVRIAYANGGATTFMMTASPDDVTEGPVPHVVAQQLTDALAHIVNGGFIYDVTYTCSGTVPEGRVISQSPSSGVLSFGATISLVVSTGSCPPATGTVPSVVGNTQAVATTVITGAGFVPNVNTVCSDTVPKGKVISQSPSAGSTRNLGTVVDLTVSSGPCPPQTGTVPSVVGNTQAVATTAITGAGFTIGSVTTVCSDTVPKGKVISQSPAGGSVRNLGTAINLVVSSGSCAPSNLEVSFKVQNQAGQFVALPEVLEVPFGHSRVFELVVSGGTPEYLVSWLDYDGHGIQFRLWFKGKDVVLSDEVHFLLSEDQMKSVVSADALDEIFLLKGVEILNRVGATLSVDLVTPGKVLVTKDYTAATQSPQTAYLFVSDSSNPMQEIEKTWKIQVE